MIGGSIISEKKAGPKLYMSPSGYAKRSRTLFREGEKLT